MAFTANEMVKAIDSHEDALNFDFKDLKELTAFAEYLEAEYGSLYESAERLLDQMTEAYAIFEGDRVRIYYIELCTFRQS